MTRYILAVMAVLGCLAVAPPHARAQTAAPAPVKIAVVDLDLVGDKFERKIVEENKLREWGQQQQAMIDQLSALPFLSTDEWQEAVAIYQTPKASWTQQQQTREKALREQSTQREREFKNLDKPDRTQEEQGRFNLLQDTLRAREADLKKIAAQLEQEFRDREAKLNAALSAPVQAVIQQLATERGYVLVLNKLMVLNGGEDITDVVIERVNAAAKAAESGGGQPPKPEGGTGEKPAAPGGEKK